MSDFVSGFWSPYITLVSLASILGCGVFLWRLSTKRLPPGKKADVMGHVWDENLEEYNNPLPRWWMWLFYLTIAFALGYLVLYPGLGTWPGLLHWTSHSQYDAEEAHATATYDPIYARYAAMPIPAVAADPQARDIGQRIFLNNCAPCHASDARGGRGYPDLTDNDWLYGGDPDTLVATITDGRNGVMPAWAGVVGDEGVKNLANYVKSLSGSAFDPVRAAQGKVLFQTNCVACHGPDGKGNHTIGAPNLTDAIWLWGGGESTIMETIAKGRNGVMPSWGSFLGPQKIHLVAAYVYSLSHAEGK
ncbi:MAG: cytochrome-c oxidase, cbb3-type subunit III [Betaproteobacteria bacterium]|nr:cytochrome-c oxidase, cbb3-type subunit III [Betaproteobacteria bacterium]MDE2208981.1 cytochrome-c oxidase, cbb3-type subunit III [Betaproteobacteria bacterium]